MRLEQTPLSSRILPKVRSGESSGAIALWEDKGDRLSGKRGALAFWAKERRSLVC
ncbi:MULTISPECIES: hypothetical protein [unclassified Microcoleus]|uniref:hypothetical protein n=1 Tax=unclassified Microcoleus TaxID=2642155 RepID=UPI002FD6F323